jgi:hypothetical protein
MPTKAKPTKSKAKADSKPAEPEHKFKVETTSYESPDETPTDEKKETVEESTGITSFSQLDTTKTAPTNIVETTVPSTEKTVEEPKVVESAAGTPPPVANHEPTKSILDPQTEDTTLPKVDPPKNDQISSEEVKEWLKDVRPDTSVDVEKTKGPGLKVFLFLFIILLVIGAVAGAVFYFKSNKDKISNISIKDSIIKATPTIETTATPIPPTVAPTVDPKELSKLTVNILNGNGIIGDASKAKTLLKDLKFKEIKTGNAEGKDYVSTTVSLKSTVPQGTYEKIKALLQNDYSVTKSDGSLEDSASTDIIIILGLRKS